MPRIFISYRRSDSKVFTGRLLDRLVLRFGNQNVFRDIEDIPIGTDFRTVLADGVGHCDVMLVIIGPQWASITDNGGNKRLFDPDDFVRFEIASGLKRTGMPVIPVLVMNASMPSPGDLPDDLKELAYRNAIVVRDDPDFTSDMARLMVHLKRIRPLESILKWALAVVPALALIAALAFFMPGRIQPSDMPPTPDITIPSTGSVGTVENALSIYEQADLNSLIVAILRRGDQVKVIGHGSDNTWLFVRLANGAEGWARADDFFSNVSTSSNAGPSQVAVSKGFGARTDAWQVYFTSPAVNPNPQTEMGIDARLAAAISQTTNTLEMAAFGFDNELLTDMILDAHERDVTIRIVTDDEYGLGDEENSFDEFEEQGIEIVTDERQALMHHSFIILDGNVVWTGSWTFTENGTYQNNDNTLVFEADSVVSLYQQEFNQMFKHKQFSADAPASPKNETSTVGIPVAVYFSPHDDVQSKLLEIIGSARQSIKFMAFSFTDTRFAAMFQSAIERGVQVTGIFETRGSDSKYSQFKPLFCAGAQVHRDGNDFLLHHKVMLIDNQIVITGSTNFSLNGLTNNNENTIIVQDPSLVQVYNEEFHRLWQETEEPDDIECD